MKSINNAAVKGLAWNLINFTDEVNSNGKQISRQNFKREHLKGVLALKKAIFDSAEFGIIDKSKNPHNFEDADVSWVSAKDFVCPPDKITVSDRHTDTEIGLDDKMLEALKYLYKDREEIPSCSLQTLEAFEELVS